ncbi:MAG: ABC transporter substrate-binding protein [Stellaceae bacterium]
MTRRAVLLAAAAVLLLASPSQAEKRYDPGASDTEIKIGQTLPLSGPVSLYATFGKASLAYVAMLNEHGGINGRKLTLILADDGFSPPRTVEQTRKLVESEGVLLIFAPVGSAPGIAVQKYLNARKVPQLFVQSGLARWNDPEHFPWSMAGLPNYGTEVRSFAKYILAHHAAARIAVLWQNDDFGRAYVDGLKAGLGAGADKMMVGTESFELTDATVDSQVITLAGTQADTLLIAATAKQTVQALRKAGALGWHPQLFIAFPAASIPRTYVPAGVENAAGAISTTVWKDPAEAAMRNDADVRAYLQWMKRYYPDGDPDDLLNVAAYVEGELLVEVLTRCGDELTRENVMRQAAAFHDQHVDMLRPGIGVSTSPDDYSLFNRFQLVRFDGTSLLPLGDPVAGD